MVEIFFRCRSQDSWLESTGHSERLQWQFPSFHWEKRTMLIFLKVDKLTWVRNFFFKKSTLNCEGKKMVREISPSLLMSLPQKNYVSRKELIITEKSYYRYYTIACKLWLSSLTELQNCTGQILEIITSVASLSSTPFVNVGQSLITSSLWWRN